VDSNALHDRTGKRSRPVQLIRFMMAAQKLKMASFSRSAVHAVVMLSNC
jgi:hypothetical protein